MLKLSKHFLHCAIIASSIVLSACAQKATEEEQAISTPEPVIEHAETAKVLQAFFEKAETELKKQLIYHNDIARTFYGEDNLYNPAQETGDRIASLKPGFLRERTQLAKSIDIIGIAQNSVVGSLLAEDMLKEFSEVQTEVSEDFVPLVAWTTSSYQLHTIEAIKSLAELKGKKIIVWDSMMATMATKLGAIPVSKTAQETLDALSNGEADGVISPFTPVRFLKFAELTKHHLYLNLGVGMFNISIPKATWERFSTDAQEYFKNEGGAKIALRLGQATDKDTVNNVEWMKNLGHTFYTLSDSDKAQVAKTFTTIKDEWLESIPAEKKDIAQKVLKHITERSSHYQAEFEKGTYSAQ